MTEKRINYSSRSLKLIDGAIKEIVKYSSSSDRTNALETFCKQNKINCTQVRDAIVQETGEEFFQDQDLKESKSSIRQKNFIKSIKESLKSIR